MVLSSIKYEFKTDYLGFIVYVRIHIMNYGSIDKGIGLSKRKLSILYAIAAAIASALPSGIPIDMKFDAIYCTKFSDQNSNRHRV
mgnify:CR=1 FL=1